MRDANIVEACGCQSGVTRTCGFSILRSTLDPDGVTRPVMDINGEFSEPIIEAN